MSDSGEEAALAFTVAQRQWIEQLVSTRVSEASGSVTTSLTTPAATKRTQATSSSTVVGVAITIITLITPGIKINSNTWDRELTWLSVQQYLGCQEV